MGDSINPDQGGSETAQTQKNKKGGERNKKQIFKTGALDCALQTEISEQCRSESDSHLNALQSYGFANNIERC